MQKNISKKIINPVEVLRKISFGIALTYLAIFLFGLFVPFSQSFALTNEPPKIEILSPTPWQEKGGTFIETGFKDSADIKIKIKATDPDGVKKVEWFNEINTNTIKKLGESTTSPYEFIWKNVPLGTYGLTIKATDNLGAVSKITITISVVRTVTIIPLAEFTTPSNQTVVSLGDKIKIGVNVFTGGEKSKGIAKVVFTYGINSKYKIELTRPPYEYELTIIKGQEVYMKTENTRANAPMEFPGGLKASIDDFGIVTAPKGYSVLFVNVKATNKEGYSSTPSKGGLDTLSLIVKEDDSSQSIDNKNTSASTDTDTTYTPLAPLPGLGDAGCKDSKGVVITDKAGNIIPCIDTQKSTTNPCPFGNYLNIIIKLVIGIAAVLAMVMIVMGGIEYMTTELVSGKENGKDTIRNAILGLLIALGAYLILNTINPQLLTACLDKLPQATITILPFDATINSYVVKTNSASCKIMTNGDCTPANLKSYFGDKAENASKICSVESGGKPDLKSGFDYCSLGDKVTFSFGLFQINLLANGDKIPKSVGSCANLFTTSKGEEIGYGKAGYIAKENGKFKGYDCKLKTERGDDYKKCRDYLLTAAGNLEMAKKLFNSKGNTFKDWQASDSVACPSAFQ